MSRTLGRLELVRLFAGFGGPGAFRRDPGRALLELSTKDDEIIQFDVRGHRIVLVIAPHLIHELLIDHSHDTTKGRALQRARALLGDGLLTSEGETHQRDRRLVAPAFSRKRLEQYVETMVRRTKSHQGKWSDGETLDVHAEMISLTMEIVGETLLGIDLEGQSGLVRNELQQLLRRYGKNSGPMFEPEQTTENVNIDVKDIEGLIANAIHQHEQDDDTNDVVSALLRARDDSGSGLTTKEIRDQLVTLLIAGHETTANALSWTFHLLGNNPACAARLHEEAKPFASRPPSFDELQHLTYTKAVLSEAMRLYPPAWIIGRRAATSFQLGDVEIPQDANILVSPYVMHRQSRWFPEPERFDPDRWLDERATNVPRYAYLPFGLGTRSCIGEQFAWMELLAAMCVISGNWRLHPVPGHQVEQQYRVTLRPATSVLMTAHRWE